MGNILDAVSGSIDPASIELPPARTIDISAWLWAVDNTQPRTER